MTASSTHEASARQSSPIWLSRMTLCGPIMQRSPITVAPEIVVSGRMSVSWPMRTLASMYVVAGSSMVTPDSIRSRKIRSRKTRAASASCTRSLTPPVSSMEPLMVASVAPSRTATAIRSVK
jgi:hypothetical protein